MVRRRDFPNIWLAALLFTYVALATWSGLTIPLGEAPDEVDHYRVLRHLVVPGDPLGFFVRITNPLPEGRLTLDVLTRLFRGLSRSFWLGCIGIEIEAIHTLLRCRFFRS